MPWPDFLAHTHLTDPATLLLLPLLLMMDAVGLWTWRGFFDG